MIVRYSIGTCILINFILLCQGYPGDGIGFGYQESEEQDPAKQNALNKKPVHFPSRCKPGELYYPGDQGDDWVCDCKPGYIYYPEKSQCYGAYRRGPCKLNEYLILPKNDVIPKCVASPCDNENFVHFGGKCHELDKPGPCPVPELENVVGVNETTLEIICTKGFSDFLKDRFLGDTSKEQIAATIFTTTTTKRPNYVDPNFYIENKCFKGGMRWIDNQCPKQNEDQNNDSQLTK